MPEKYLNLIQRILGNGAQQADRDVAEKFGGYGDPIERTALYNRPVSAPPPPAAAPPAPTIKPPTQEGRIGKSIEYRDLRAQKAADFSGEYDTGLINDIVRISKESGVDPYIMIALGLQETNLGTRSGDLLSGRVFNVESTAYEGKRQQKHQQFLQEAFMEDLKYYSPPAAERRANIRRAAELLKAKKGQSDAFFQKKKGRDATYIEWLQSWQGFGKMPREFDFGKNLGRQLVGWKDLPHGERVRDHIESLKQDPVINQIIQSTFRTALLEQ